LYSTPSHHSYCCVESSIDVYVALHTEADGAKDLPIFTDAFIRANYTTMSAYQNGKWYAYSLASPQKDGEVRTSLLIKRFTTYSTMDCF
jgi:hypothetical protein